MRSESTSDGTSAPPALVKRESSEPAFGPRRSLQATLQKIATAAARGPSQSVLYADRLASTLREGDIVLFAGKHDLGAACIRSCTRSDYNHVAMVVRTSDGELELFEAGPQGVAQIPLEFYINRCVQVSMPRPLRACRLIIQRSPDGHHPPSAASTGRT